MNKKIVTLSIFLSLFVVIICPFQVVFAQQMPDNGFGGTPNPIHPDAVPGSTSQRQQAWEGMTPQQQDQAIQDLQQIFNKRNTSHQRLMANTININKTPRYLLRTFGEHKLNIRCIKKR